MNSRERNYEQGIVDGHGLARAGVVRTGSRTRFCKKNSFFSKKSGGIEKKVIFAGWIMKNSRLGCIAATY